MNQGTNIQNTPNAETPGLFKNIVTDIGNAGLTAVSQLPGLVFKQLSNQANDIGVYLVGIPTQEFANNENAVFAKVKDFILRLDEFDNKLGNDEQLKELRKKITGRLIQVVGGTIDDLINNEKLSLTLNNLLDKLNRSGINIAKVFITGAKDVVLEIPGLGAVVAIVDTGTKVVVAGSTILASFIEMTKTGAIIAETTNKAIQQVIGIINEFSIPMPNTNLAPALPNINEMREGTYPSNLVNNVSTNKSLPTIGEMRRNQNFIGGGANYLKTLTKRKNNIEKRISGSIGNFMNNKLTKKRRRHKYTHKRHSKR